MVISQAKTPAEFMMNMTTAEEMTARENAR